jgi:hypothetical protein
LSAIGLIPPALKNAAALARIGRKMGTGHFRPIFLALSVYRGWRVFFH